MSQHPHDLLKTIVEGMQQQGEFPVKVRRAT
jgi:hypothetical protein